MGKFKHGIVQDIEERREFEKEQASLKAKHHIETDKVIVEKSNMVKFTVKTLSGLVKTGASILLCGLALLGLMALVYPGPRQEMAGILLSVYQQLQQYLAFLP